jgi:hypothetical protein
VKAHALMLHPTSAKAVHKIVILKTDREEVGSVVCNGMQL